MSLAPGTVGIARAGSGPRAAWLAVPLVLGLLVPALHAAEPRKEWAPIPAEDFAQDSAIVEAGATLECLSFDEWITFSDPMGSASDVTHDRWVRLKILTDEGAQAVSRIDVDLPPRGTRLLRFEGRTTGPDGTVTVVRPSDIYKETVLRLGNRSVRRHSFTPPRVVRGAIVDYRVRWVSQRGTQNFEACPMAFRWPARRVTYHLRMPKSPGLTAKHRLYRTEARASEGPIGGYQEISVLHARSLREEPLSPPDEDVRPMMLVYIGATSTAAGDFWRNHGSQLALGYEYLTRPEAKARVVADSLTAGLEAPWSKVERLMAWMREAFAVVPFEDGALDRAGLKDVRSGEEAVAQRGGHEAHAVMAFGALARAAGLQVRAAFANSGSVGFFDPAVPLPAMLPTWLAAVRVDTSWRFLDPGARGLPWNMVRHAVEGRQALRCEDRASVFVTLPASGPEASVSSRRLRLECSADGVLEGSCEASVSGHLAALVGRLQDAEGAGPRDSLALGVFTSGETSHRLDMASIEPVGPGSSQRRLRARFRAGDLGIVVGRRMVLSARDLLLAPAPRLQAAERTLPIELPMAWTEADSIEIGLPEGWKVEATDAPAERVVPGVLAYRCRWIHDPVGRRLVLQRRLELGVGGRIRYPVSAYVNFLSVLEEIHQHDGMTVTLIPEGTE